MGMVRLGIRSPFDAPVYHKETVGSTMDASRLLAGGGAPHGTVICADFQEAGRGRLPGRPWNAPRRDGLLFTVLLRFPGAADIPRAITLRTGLAVALAVEDLLPELAGAARVKWPNDVMLPVRGEGGISYRKAVGILVEASGGDVHVGIGANVLQREFPAGLRATSLALAAGGENPDGLRFRLLEKILARLHSELAELQASDGWRERLEARLYMKGERIRFAEGAGSAPELAGTLAGIGADGELLVVPEGGAAIRAFVSGELRPGF